MRARRGFAMLAALWLVVAIAVVVLQFSLEARERRQLGLQAADRGIGRAAAVGALAMVQATLEEALVVGPGTTNAAAARLRGADPWLGADSVFGGTYLVDSIPVDVEIVDLGARLNVNSLNEVELRTFFSFLLRDMERADVLAQSIMDWRDTDSLPRVRGAERDYYLEQDLLVTPANAPFRQLDELLLVNGMTPEIYAAAMPYLVTMGAPQVNINTAPEAVLRALPGMTDDVLMRILALRSSGRRIQNVQQVLAMQQGGGGNRGRGGGGGQQPTAASQRLQSRIDVVTNMLELRMTAQPATDSRPTRLVAGLSRTNNNTTIMWKQW